jgi:predicted lipid-binding transport protein (Tim44 family)
MSAFTPTPTTTTPATATPARTTDPSISTAAPTVGAAPEQYRSAAGCLILSLATVAALGALALFVALIGDVSP